MAKLDDIKGLLKAYQVIIARAEGEMASVDAKHGLKALKKDDGSVVDYTGLYKSLKGLDSSVQHKLLNKLYRFTSMVIHPDKAEFKKSAAEVLFSVLTEVNDTVNGYYDGKTNRKELEGKVEEVLVRVSDERFQLDVAKVEANIQAIKDKPLIQEINAMREKLKKSMAPHLDGMDGITDVLKSIDDVLNSGNREVKYEYARLKRELTKTQQSIPIMLNGYENQLKLMTGVVTQAHKDWVDSIADKPELARTREAQEYQVELNNMRELLLTSSVDFANAKSGFEQSRADLNARVKKLNATNYRDVMKYTVRLNNDMDVWLKTSTSVLSRAWARFTRMKYVPKFFQTKHTNMINTALATISWCEKVQEDFANPEVEIDQSTPEKLVDKLSLCVSAAEGYTWGLSHEANKFRDAVTEVQGKVEQGMKHSANVHRNMG